MSSSTTIPRKKVTQLSLDMIPLVSTLRSSSRLFDSKSESPSLADSIPPPNPVYLSHFSEVQASLLIANLLQFMVNDNNDLSMELCLACKTLGDSLPENIKRLRVVRRFLLEYVQDSSTCECSSDKIGKECKLWIWRMFILSGFYDVVCKFIRDCAALDATCLEETLRLCAAIELVCPTFARCCGPPLDMVSEALSLPASVDARSPTPSNGSFEFNGLPLIVSFSLSHVLVEVGPILGSHVPLHLIFSLMLGRIDEPVVDLTHVLSQDIILPRLFSSVVALAFSGGTTRETQKKVFECLVLLLAANSSNAEKIVSLPNWETYVVTSMSNLYDWKAECASERVERLAVCIRDSIGGLPGLDSGDLVQVGSRQSARLSVVIDRTDSKATDPSSPSNTSSSSSTRVLKEPSSVASIEESKTSVEEEEEEKIPQRSSADAEREIFVLQLNLLSILLVSMLEGESASDQTYFKLTQILDGIASTSEDAETLSRVLLFSSIKRIRSSRLPTLSDQSATWQNLLVFCAFLLQFVLHMDSSAHQSTISLSVDEHDHFPDYSLVNEWSRFLATQNLSTIAGIDDRERKFVERFRLIEELFINLRSFIEMLVNRQEQTPEGVADLIERTADLLRAVFRKNPRKKISKTTKADFAEALTALADFILQRGVHPEVDDSHTNMVRHVANEALARVHQEILSRSIGKLEEHKSPPTERASDGMEVQRGVSAPPSAGGGAARRTTMFGSLRINKVTSSISEEFGKIMRKSRQFGMGTGGDEKAAARRSGQLTPPVRHEVPPPLVSPPEEHGLGSGADEKALPTGSGGSGRSTPPAEEKKRRRELPPIPTREELEKMRRRRDERVAQSSQSGQSTPPVTEKKTRRHELPPIPTSPPEEKTSPKPPESPVSSSSGQTGGGEESKITIEEISVDELDAAVDTIPRPRHQLLPDPDDPRLEEEEELRRGRNLRSHISS